jgi:hypothetical protein
MTPDLSVILVVTEIAWFWKLEDNLSSVARGKGFPNTSDHKIEYQSLVALIELALIS